MHLATRLGFNDDIGAKIFDDIWSEHCKLNNKKLPPSGQVPAEATIEAAYLLHSIKAKTNDLRPMIREWMLGGRAESASPLLASGKAAKKAKKKFAPDAHHKRLDEDTLLDLEKLKGNVHGLLRKLRSVLRADLQVVQNMFRAWDANGSFHITYNEFADALAALGFSSKKELTRAIFDELDDDASFTLGFREFKAWLFSSDEEFERRLLD